MTAKESPLELSLRQRLLNLARARGEDFQDVLMRYGLERWLYRLSHSTHASQFILKGALLFALWSEVPGRPTHDLDLLGFGEISIARLEEVVRQVCAVSGGGDGLTFVETSIKAELRREDEHYPGLRVKVLGQLGVARIPVTIDIGFGDVITPAPQLISFPTLLDQPAPQVRASTKETVIAEKLHIMVARGLFNTRLKDYSDLAVLAHHHSFAGPLLCQAMTATFARRETPIPATPPAALTRAFSKDAGRVQQWRAFLRKSRLQQTSLEEVVVFLQGFLLPPLQAAAAAEPFEQSWTPGGPWKALGQTD